MAKKKHIIMLSIWTIPLIMALLIKWIDPSGTVTGTIVLILITLSLVSITLQITSFLWDYMKIRGERKAR